MSFLRTGLVCAFLSVILIEAVVLGVPFVAIGDIGDQPVDVCTLPEDPGTPCEEPVPRYYFDPKTKSCKTFSYGGCGGNGNNFRNEIECIDKCRCQRPMELGKCEAFTSRYYYDMDVQKCIMFIYGGCGENGNNFETKLECSSNCVCQLPKEVGTCDQSLDRYYYDDTDTLCKKFQYGGCEGNRNKFDSIDECDNACRCLLPVDPGPCEAMMTRFYYNTERGRCEEFNYGGCHGNGNNFISKKDCHSTCHDRKTKNTKRKRNNKA